MDEHKLEYSVDWRVKDKFIHIDRRFTVDGHMQKMQSSMINTDEGAVRAALVKLGWTPPKDGGQPDRPVLVGQRWMLTSLDVSAIDLMIKWLKRLAVAELAICDEHTVYFTTYGGDDVVCDDPRIAVWKLQKRYGQ